MTDEPFAPVPNDRLRVAIWEADRHVAALNEALAEWQTLPTPSWRSLEENAPLRRLCDQILFRFMKLQDGIGQRLIAASLQVLLEPFENWPMRDRLDRLEKLGLLDVDDWLRWRDIRNRLAHEYPDEPELRLAAVVAAIDAAQELVDAYGAWKLKLRP